MYFSDFRVFDFTAPARNVTRDGQNRRDVTVLFGKRSEAAQASTVNVTPARA